MDKYDKMREDAEKIVRSINMIAEHKEYFQKLAKMENRIIEQHMDAFFPHQNCRKLKTAGQTLLRLIDETGIPAVYKVR